MRQIEVITGDSVLKSIVLIGQEALSLNRGRLIQAIRSKRAGAVQTAFPFLNR